LRLLNVIDQNGKMSKKRFFHPANNLRIEEATFKTVVFTGFLTPPL
jgi:hypothetical protein